MLFQCGAMSGNGVYLLERMGTIQLDLNHNMPCCQFQLPCGCLFALRSLSSGVQQTVFERAIMGHCHTVSHSTQSIASTSRRSSARHRQASAKPSRSRGRKGGVMMLPSPRRSPVDLMGDGTYLFRNSPGSPSHAGESQSQCPSSTRTVHTYETCTWWSYLTFRKTSSMWSIRGMQ